jgi:hypothetical protein
MSKEKEKDQITLLLPALIPVIHVYDEEQTIECATMAFEAGCDGVFLIAHGNNKERKRAELIVSCYKEVRSKFPRKYASCLLRRFFTSIKRCF